MQTGYQTSVLVLGGGLALATLWKQDIPQQLWSVLATNSNSASFDMQQGAKTIGIDILALFVALWLAGLSDDSGKIMIALVLGLWLLFLMRGASSTINATHNHQ